MRCWKKLNEMQSAYKACLLACLLTFRLNWYKQKKRNNNNNNSNFSSNDFKWIKKTDLNARVFLAQPTDACSYLSAIFQEKKKLTKKLLAGFVASVTPIARIQLSPESHLIPFARSSIPPLAPSVNSHLSVNNIRVWYLPSWMPACLLGCLSSVNFLLLCNYRTQSSSSPLVFQFDTCKLSNYWFEIDNDESAGNFSSIYKWAFVYAPPSTKCDMFVDSRRQRQVQVLHLNQAIWSGYDCGIALMSFWCQTERHAVKCLSPNFRYRIQQMIDKKMKQKDWSLLNRHQPDRKCWSCKQSGVLDDKPPKYFICSMFVLVADDMNKWDL